MGLAEAAETDAKTKARLRFTVEQITAASAPSNFMCLNAAAQKIAIETHGESISKSMQNLLKDIQQGQMTLTDKSVFEVGRNLAVTNWAEWAGCRIAPRQGRTPNSSSSKGDCRTVEASALLALRRANTMMMALASGVLLGPSAGLSPGPMTMPLNHDLGRSPGVASVS